MQHHLFISGKHLFSNCSQPVIIHDFGSLLADEDFCPNHEGDARVVCGSEGVQEPALWSLPLCGLVDGLWHWLNLCLPLLASPGEATSKQLLHIFKIVIFPHPVSDCYLYPGSRCKTYVSSNCIFDIKL